jgi:sterol desaturase/sphingolipid hydroxylase (fatty acid hydroxylase superfamily)
LPYVSLGESPESWQHTLGFVLGVVFWLGILGGVLFMRPISKKRKSDVEYNKIERKITFFRFFRNKPAILSDVLLIISVVVVIAMFIAPTPPQIVLYRSIFGLVFSVEMHDVFNGRNYEYLSNIQSLKEGY